MKYIILTLLIASCGQPPKPTSSPLKIDSAILRDHDSVVASYGLCDTCNRIVFVGGRSGLGGWKQPIGVISKTSGGFRIADHIKASDTLPIQEYIWRDISDTNGYPIDSSYLHLNFDSLGGPGDTIAPNAFQTIHDSSGMYYWGRNRHTAFPPATTNCFNYSDTSAMPGVAPKKKRRKG